MLKDLFHTTDEKKNDKLVTVIRSWLKDLEEVTEEMSDYQNAIEKPDKIVDIAEEILDFNRQNQNQKCQ